MDGRVGLGRILTVPTKHLRHHISRSRAFAIMQRQNLDWLNWWFFDAKFKGTRENCTIPLLAATSTQLNPRSTTRCHYPRRWKTVVATEAGERTAEPEVTVGPRGYLKTSRRTLAYPGNRGPHAHLDDR